MELVPSSQGGSEVCSRLFNLDLRPFFNPFSLPTLEVVLQKVGVFRPDEDGVMVIPLRGKGLGIYKITFRDDVPVNNECGLIFNVKIMWKDEAGIDKWGTEDTLIPLVPPPARPVGAFHSFGPTYTDGSGAEGGGGARRGRPDGTLITFLNCASGPLEDVPNQIFDQAMQMYGAVCKPTVYQRHRGTQYYNGNRFCVLEPSTKIPASITIPYSGKSFNITIRYKGQDWFCSRCNVKHMGPCASLQAFYAQKDARKEIEIKTALLSDSSLRRVTEVGLKADVICMPGGRLGEVANLLKDTPDLQKKDKVVLVAGTNDVMSGTPHSDFLYTTERSCAKVAQLSTTITPHLVVVPPNLPAEALTPIQERRQTYLNLKLLQLEGETVDVTLLPQVDMEDSVHPSPAGTEQWLENLDQAHFPDSLIMNPSYLTGDRVYVDNTPVYVYGCTTCHQERDITDGFCNACREDMSNYVPEATGEAFPQLMASSRMITELFGTDTERAAALKSGALLERDGLTFIDLNAPHPILAELVATLLGHGNAAAYKTDPPDPADDPMDDANKRVADNLDQSNSETKKLCQSNHSSTSSEYVDATDTT